MLIKSINTLLLITSISLNLLFINLLFYFNSEFNRKLVYDIDTIRTQYQRDVNFYFNIGCRAGTDYPPEYRERTKSGEFGLSTVNYCDDKRQDISSMIDESTFYLGKKNAQGN